MKFNWALILVLLISLFPTPAIAANDVIKVTRCLQAFGYKNLAELQRELLTEAKISAVDEVFGQFITASTAVKNSVITDDQIHMSSIGYIHLEGQTKYYNGENLAEVCVDIQAYVTDKDKEKFTPERIEKKNDCVAGENLTTKQLKEYARDELIIHALIDYNPKLKGKDKDNLLKLMQKVDLSGSTIDPDSGKFCATLVGYVVPVEIEAFLVTDSSASSTTESSSASFATFTTTIASGEQTEYLSQKIWIPAVPTEVARSWPSLPGATWVWKAYRPTLTEARNGSEVITFRQTFTIPLDARNIGGTIHITADNAYELSLNGIAIGRDGTLDILGKDGSWDSVEDFQIYPKPGNNELTIRAINYAGPQISEPNQNPAGVLFRADVTYESAASPAIALGTLLFKDNFDSSDAQGWVPATGVWNVVKGHYVCVSADDGRTFWGEQQWSDYIVKASITPFSGSIDFGILGRLQDANHFYLAQLIQGRARIYRNDGQWTELASVPYETTNNVQYEVKMEFRGTQINMYVNGILVATAQDAIFLRGKVGLRCASSSQVYFDDVTVEPLSN